METLGAGTNSSAGETQESLITQENEIIKNANVSLISLITYLYVTRFWLKASFNLLIKNKMSYCENI